MQTLARLAAVCLLALPMSASTIDIYAAASQTLHNGDSLDLLFSDASFVSLAGNLGISPYPEQFSFSFVSLPADPAGQFDAVLQSFDGSVSAAFSNVLTWSPGIMQAAGYSGPISSVYGTLNLSGAVSQQVFAASQADLILTYFGPDAVVEIPGYTLERDFRTGVAGGGASAGNMNSALTITQSVFRLTGSFDHVNFDESTGAAPEPDTAVYCIVAGALFCGLSAALKRFARRRI